MIVAELIKELEKVKNKDLEVRCSKELFDIHFRYVRIEKNTYVGITDEFVNIC